LLPVSETLGTDQVAVPVKLTFLILCCLFYFVLVVDLKNKKTFIFFVTEFAQSRVGDPPDPEMVVTRNTCQARNQPADGEPSAQPQVEPPMQLPTRPLVDMEAFCPSTVSSGGPKIDRTSNFARVGRTVSWGRYHREAP
jgi:hypothetical protein